MRDFEDVSADLADLMVELVLPALARDEMKSRKRRKK